MPEAKGAALRATLDFVTQQAGDDVLAAALARLSRTQRATVRATQPTDTIPLALLIDLWRAVDEVLAPTLPDWIERAGAHSIDSFGMKYYAGILRKTTPAEFLNQPVKLYRLFYDTGDMRVVEQADGRAVLRLVDLSVHDRLFCRRQSGGLHRALELAGADRVRVRHVRCTFDGDLFCEWDLEWHLGSDS